MAMYLIDVCLSLTGMAVGTDIPGSMSDEDRWRAVRHDIDAWYTKWISARHDGKCRRIGDSMITSGYALISSEAYMDEANLGDLLDWYREHATTKSLYLYYLSSTPPNRLSRSLLDKGATLETRPHWMWCDLDRRPNTQRNSSDINVKWVERLQSSDPGISVFNSLAKEKPRTVFHVIAFRGETLLGSCVLNTTADAERGRYNEVGGLYNMETKPAFRRQGVGLALAYYTCNLAADLGLHHLYLNASTAGESVYKRVGFEHMRPSWTWCLDVEEVRDRRGQLRERQV